MDITAWAEKHFHKSSVCEDSSPCHPQMQIKAILCKEEAMCEHNPETAPCPLG